ncbi:MAG: hypothetical protein M1812_007812 [Candelaria pacifica]|nr:MAG: hypothetical protein M1812_007812 [Candelaria pacifica]
MEFPNPESFSARMRSTSTTKRRPFIFRGLMLLFQLALTIESKYLRLLGRTPEFYILSLMASSEVDQKYLGEFAKHVREDNPLLSSMLYKILGLSVMIAKKLVKARRLRKLDTTRDTPSLQLYHHIIWQAREGLDILDHYVLPMVANFPELKVLTFKLQASFYHIYVLFHNEPRVNQRAIPTFQSPPGLSAIPRMNGAALAGGPSNRSNPTTNGGPVGGQLPPGLTPVSVPRPTASFLLPAIDYIPKADYAFGLTCKMAENLLPGSHPLRLSVKMEYAAFLYDCLKDQDGSRRLARQAIVDVYKTEDGIGDEEFEDAKDLVAILGRMTKRGLDSTPASTPDASSSSTLQFRNTPRGSAGVMPAIPSPGMNNPI